MKKLVLATLVLLLLGLLVFEYVLTPSLAPKDFSLDDRALVEYLEESEELLSSSGHLEYFGFAVIDCGYDDPTTTEVESSYFQEVREFSNISHACAFSPDDNVQPTLQSYREASTTALLYVENILFERQPGGELSGELVSLRTDYRERWETFEEINFLTNWSDQTVLYLVDEPLWNSVSDEELQEVSGYLKSRLPDMRQFTVYSYAMVGEQFSTTPNTIEWIGYNQYGVPNPLTHAEYQSDLEILTNSLSDEQKLVVVFESMWLPQYRRYDFKKKYVPTMTAHYYRLAVEEQKAIALIGYVWPNGFDGEGVRGARSLTNVHSLYQNMYHSLSGDTTQEDETQVFVDDFESELVFDPLKGWKQKQLVRGEVERVSDPNETNNTVIRATAGKRTFFGEVGKADLIKRFFPIPHGKKITVQAQFYFPEDSALDSLLLIDIECSSCGLDTNPGPRLYIRDGMLRIDRGKIGFDDSFLPSVEHQLQRGMWHEIRWEMRGGVGNDGNSKVYVDGELVSDVNDTTVLTQEVLNRYGLELTGNHFDSVQVGLTANSNSNEQTIFFDDVRISIED